MFFKEVRYAGKDAVSDRGFKKTTGHCSAIQDLS